MRWWYAVRRWCSQGSTLCHGMRLYMRLACSTCDVKCESHMLPPRSQLSVSKCDVMCDSHVQHAMESASRICCNQIINSLSQDAILDATRTSYMRFNMRLACVALGPTFVTLIFFLGIRLDASFSEFCWRIGPTQSRIFPFWGGKTTFDHFGKIFLDQTLFLGLLLHYEDMKMLKNMKNIQNSLHLQINLFFLQLSDLSSLSLREQSPISNLPQLLLNH